MQDWVSLLRLAKLASILLMDLDAVVLTRFRYVREGKVAVGIGNAVDLVKAG